MTVVHSILESVTPHDIYDLGGPVVIKEKALPPAYYAELEAGFPSLDAYAREASVANNAVYRWPAVESLPDEQLPRVWRDFVAYHTSKEFFRDFTHVLGPAVRAAHPRYERNFGKPLEAFQLDTRERGKYRAEDNRTPDMVLDAQFSWNTPVREVSSVRGPHLDSPYKLFAALLYFRDVNDTSTGGEFEFYRYRKGKYPHPKAARIDPDTVECFRTVPYAPNTLVLFINSPNQIHGVAPRSITPFTRKYVNFLGECYGGRAPDFFIAPGTRSPYWWRQLRRLARRAL